MILQDKTVARSGRAYDEPKHQAIRYGYEVLQMTTSEIARELVISTSRVWRVLKSDKVVMRQVGRPSHISQKSRYKYLKIRSNNLRSLLKKMDRQIMELLQELSPYEDEL